jgi:hypothetical protein
MELITGLKDAIGRQHEISGSNVINRSCFSNAPSPCKQNDEVLIGHCDDIINVKLSAILERNGEKCVSCTAFLQSPSAS